MRLAVVGASGRMGRSVVRLAHEAKMELVCAVASTDVGRDAGVLAGIGMINVPIVWDLGALEEARADVVIDFSTAGLVREVCTRAERAKTAIVSGTTGLDAKAVEALEEASKAVPVLWEPNMSVGVYVLAQLVSRAVELLGINYDIEIVETHHKLKIDAPSGTAYRLADAAKTALESHSIKSNYVSGREGRAGPRPPNEIGLHAVRGGDVIGDHSVHLLGNGERIELVHRASNRDLFAEGAVRAAGALAGKPAGRYGLGDVLAWTSGAAH